MDLDSTPTISIGAIVRFEAPGSRGQEDDAPRLIPAVVINVWPDQSLQLFALHFEGSFLVNSIPRERVHPVLSAGMFHDLLASFDRRLRKVELELNGRATTEVPDRVPARGTLAAVFAAEHDAGEPLKFQLTDAPAGD